MRRALVRPPGKTFSDALTLLSPRPPVDLELARAQHAGYAAALSRCGLNVAELPPDHEHPDAVFVQDRVAVVAGRAIVGPSAVASRGGEEGPIVEAIERFFPVLRLPPPATLDWGDVLVTDNALFVGLSQRSNLDAVEALSKLLAPDLSVEAVPVPNGVLHLLSECSWLGEGSLLGIDAFESFARAQEFRFLRVPAGEEEAANVLALGRDVLMPAGYPKTAALIRQLGWRVSAVEVGEFAKRDGGVTCLSILY